MYKIDRVEDNSTLWVSDPHLIRYQKRGWHAEGADADHQSSHTSSPIGKRYARVV